MRSLARIYPYYYSTSNRGEALPTDFEGLQFWRSVPLLQGLNNDDLVETITDQSGNGRHLTQPSVNNQSLYKTNQLNGLPGINLNGAVTAGNVYNQQNGKTDVDFLHTGSSTYFAVLKSTSGDVNRVLYNDGPGISSANVGRSIVFRPIGGGNNNSITDTIRKTGGTLVSKNELPADTVPTGEFFILVIRFDVTTGLHEIFINNALVKSVTKSSDPDSATAASTPQWFGISGSTTERFKGIFIEDFAYNRALTDDEIQQLSGGSNFGL